MAVERPRMAIVADVHERASGILDVLRRLGAEVEATMLPAGDYRVGGGRLVERKTIRDLHLSMVEGRFFRQLGDLRTSCALPYLLVEGRELDRGPLPRNAVRGALLTVGELGITVIRADDRDDSAAWLIALAKRGRRRRARARPAYAQRPAARPDDVPEAMLAAVPGISAKSSRALLGHFGTVERVFRATREELESVPGIGPVRAAGLVGAITRSPHAYRSRRRERPGRAT